MKTYGRQRKRTKKGYGVSKGACIIRGMNELTNFMQKLVKYLRDLESILERMNGTNCMICLPICDTYADVSPTSSSVSHFVFAMMTKPESQSGQAAQDGSVRPPQVRCRTSPKLGNFEPNWAYFRLKKVAKKRGPSLSNMCLLLVYCGEHVLAIGLLRRTCACYWFTAANMCLLLVYCGES